MLNDYTAITADDVIATTDAALADADRLLDAIAGTADGQIDFATTLGRLDEAGAMVSDAYGRGAFMARVHPDAEVRSAAIEAEERLTKWGTDVVFRRDVYEVIARYATSDEAAALEGPQRRLLDFVMRDYRRAGQQLDGDARNHLQEMRRRLVELEVAFGTNIDEWTDGIDVDRSQLDGLPDDYIDRLATTDDGKFWVSMDYPDYMPFMRHATDRGLRETLQFKFWNRAVVENRPLLEEAVALRQEVAELLGYENWAAYTMEVKMAGEPGRVDELYDSIVPGLTSMATTELATLQSLIADELDGDQLRSWDWMYAHTRQRRNDYGIDPAEVARYFPLESVVDGMFELTGEVFGLDYRRIEDPEAWHPDVFAYEIRNRGEDEILAYFYADLFPREGKFGHAAAFPVFYGRRRPDGSYRKPVAAIVANLTKPTADSPSLLEHDEAVTLFHEFGHVLHFCLTEVELHRFSGYDAEWDFVEAPSQIMENWMWEVDVLQRFARHSETGEPIPPDLVERLVAARDLNAGLFEVRQVFLGSLDLMLHTGGPDRDLDEIYRTAYAATLLPFHDGTFFPASFGHLMGGYDAGYYGYLWARVYGDDMFSAFEEGGVTNPEVGAAYRREVLATGGSRDAIEHLRAFLGREPNSDAFMRRLGLS